MTEHSDVGVVSTAATRRRRGALFFDCNEAPDELVVGLGARLNLPPSLRAAIDVDQHLDKLIWRQPLIREGNLSLSGFHIAADRTLPHHAPPGSYMAWVWEGSVRHSSGGRVLKHGAGFYARPDQPYSLTAGPTGSRLIIFGTSAALPEDLLDSRCSFANDPAAWCHPVPPDTPVDSTVFFDWNDEPQYLFENLQDRNASLPETVRAGVDLAKFFDGWYWGQPLPMDPQSDVRPGSYYQAPNSYLPRHRHMGECVYFVAEGSLIQGNRVSRPGSGWYGPPANPYSVGAGASGLRMLELHTEHDRVADDDPLPKGVRTTYLEDDPTRWVAPPKETMHPDPFTTTRRYRDLRKISGLAD